MRNLSIIATQVLGIEGTLSLAEMSREELGELLAVLQKREREIRDREHIPLDLLALANRRTSKVRSFLNEEFPVRIWGLEPHEFCKDHLLLEHAQLHMIVGALARGRDLSSYVTAGHIDLRSLASRHAIVVSEMNRRGLRHRTALSIPDSLKYGDVESPEIDVERSKAELSKLCINCAMFIRNPRQRKGALYYV